MFGFKAAITPATPATMGEAMEVPGWEAYPPPGTEERMFEPGAAYQPSIHCWKMEIFYINHLN